MNPSDELTLGRREYEEKNYKQAYVHVERVVGHEDVSEYDLRDALNFLGYLYRVATDYSKALTYYERSSSLGDPIASNNLGIMYFNGVGVTRDYDEAVLYFEKSHNLGSRSGTENLAFMYAQGKGVPPRYRESDIP